MSGEGDFLGRFFAAMDRYLHEHPDQPERLVAQFPEWSVDPRRVGIYGRFVQEYVHDVLDKLFPVCAAAAGEARWRSLCQAYYPRRTAGHFELNQVGAGVAGFLADLLARGENLPPFLPDLARLEWAQFAAFGAEVEVPARVTALTVNPTLQTLQHPWLLCAYCIRTQRDGAPPPAGPAPGDELALVWRVPGAHLARYRAADARALLALKLAVEGIPPERAAAEGGVPVEQVEAAVRDLAERGLVLLPG